MFTPLGRSKRKRTDQGTRECLLIVKVLLRACLSMTHMYFSLLLAVPELYVIGKYLQDWVSCRNSRFRVNVTSSSYVRGNYKEEKQDLIYFPLQMYVDSDPKKLQLMWILLRSLQINLESWNIRSAVYSKEENRKDKKDGLSWPGAPSWQYSLPADRQEERLPRC